MDKQSYFLKKYGIVLDQTATPEAQNQLMKIAFGVKDIEIGDKPYIFVSYSHKDSAVVFPAIRAIQEKGYPVWYDDSIRTGVAWRNHIAERVRDSALVIAFMSENSVVSKNCIAEVDHAIDLNLPILTVRLDQSEIPSGLNMYLKRDQMFSAYLYDGEAYINRLAVEPFIAETAGEALDAYNSEKRRAAEEVERKRKEAEAAERRRKEAEEAERKRKEAEEAERRRKIAEELENRQRRKEELARKRRELEEADRRRREAAAIELRLLEDEEAELERLNEAAKRTYVDPVELELKYNEAVAELEEERSIRESAERKCREATAEVDKERRLRTQVENKLSNAQRHIANLKSGNTKAKTSESLSPKIKAAKEKMARYYDDIGIELLSTKYSNYFRAINIFKKNMRPLAERYLQLKPDLERYKDSICATIYRDARIFERRRQKRKARDLYLALPKDYGDAMMRADSIESSVESRVKGMTWCIFLLYLAAIFLVVKYVYNVENSFGFNTLISVAPMSGAVLLWFCCNWSWAYTEDFYCLCGIVLSALISIFICPFLYPEMSFWLKITASVGYNLASAAIGWLVMWLLGEISLMGELKFIGCIDDESDQNEPT